MIVGRSLAHAFPPRRAPARALGPEVLGAERLVDRGQAAATPRSRCAPGRSSASPACKAWASSTSFSPVSAWPISTRGHLRVDGQPIVITSPTDAVRANIGISLVPEDRKTEALSLKLSGKHNASLPVIDALLPRSADRRRAPRAAAVEARVRARRCRPPRAVDAGRRLLRRQPAEDRHRQMAARRKPRPAAVRSDPRHRRRHQERALPADPRLCRRGRRGAVLLDRDPRDSCISPTACSCSISGRIVAEIAGDELVRGSDPARRARDAKRTGGRLDDRRAPPTASLARRAAASRAEAARPPARPRHRDRRSSWSLLGDRRQHRRGPLSYYDLSQMAASGATLALAAIGQTIVILSGGFDLSAGAVISLVNVVLASSLQDPATVAASSLVAAGVGVGMASGAFNGFFVAVLRMQPIVVTLADDVHPAGRHAAGHGQAGRPGLARARRSPDRRRDPQSRCRSRSCSSPSFCCSGRG